MGVTYAKLARSCAKQYLNMKITEEPIREDSNYGVRISCRWHRTPFKIFSSAA
jgi:hypothetical protein